MTQAAKETTTAKEQAAAKERQRPRTRRRRRRAPTTEREPAPAADEDAPAGGTHVCNVAFCPIGLALTAAERVQPDVVVAPAAGRPRVLPRGARP